MRAHALVCLLVTAALLAQDAVDDPFGHSRHGGTFDEGPRQAAYLMAGMSPQVHLPVAGLSAEAQAFFDQGITQQHGFWYFEAERSFRQVAKLQPDCAMAYWGMALANVENPPRAAGFLANAVERSAKVPHYEQLWIDAWAHYYGIDAACRTELQSGDPARVKQAMAALIDENPADDKVVDKAQAKQAKEKRERQLLKDLGTLVFEFPADLEAKAFLALQNWLASDWGNGIPIVSHTAIDALLDQVFAKAPLHPAHHYRIHLWDAEAGSRALASAAVNGSTAPGIAHQWHMAGHIYAKLDRHREAAWQQQASGRVDHAHMMRDRVMPFLIHNYGHNQEWLARSLSYQGLAEEGLEVVKNLAELPRHPKYNQVDKSDDIAGYARTRLVTVCEDHRLWAEAVALCTDGHLERSEAVLAEVPRLGLLGRALFRLGRLDEAERVVAAVAPLLAKARAERAAAIDRAEDEALAKPDGAEHVWTAIADAGRHSTDAVRAVLDLQHELRGEQLLAKGDAKAALVEFEAVKDLPKALLADAQVAAGEPQKAIDLLEKEVKDRPNRLPTMARLLLAYRAAAKPEQQTRLDELTKQLHGEQFACEEPRHGSLARDARLLGRPGTSLRLPMPEDEDDTSTFGADFGARPSLASLGPAQWHPVAAADFDLPCADGTRRSLLAQRGKPTLVVFYLGFGCLHCVQQLEALSPKAKQFAAAGIDILAIGNETLAKVQDNLAALGDQRFPFPMLADAELAAFKAWRCYDDFEALPLHGTFLVDGHGLVRWQDISFEPFTQFDWLLTESQRLLQLPASAAGSGSK